MLQAFTKRFCLLTVVLLLSVVNALAQDVIEIGSVADLKAFRDKVNKGDHYQIGPNQCLNGDLVGKTIKLTADLDLQGEEWTPIYLKVGDPSGGISTTFDGDGHTISNLTISSQPDLNIGVGLFSYLGSTTLKNLTLENVNITGNYRVGAFVGCEEGVAQIDSCHLDGGTIITSVVDNDNAHHVGGIVGYLASSHNNSTNSSVTNCSVKNVTIQGYRDMGSIVGTLTTGESVTQASVISGCSAENVTLIQDNTTNYKNYAEPSPSACNIHEIVGRVGVGGPNKIEKNTFSNVTFVMGKTASDVALIGNVKYTTLAAAIAAVQDGQTITLLKDYDFEANEPGYGYTTAFLAEGETAARNNMLVFSADNITFDLGGHTISNLFNNTFNVTGSNVTFQNGEMRVGQLYYSGLNGKAYTTENEKTCSYIVYVTNATDFTVNNLTTYGGINVSASTATINDLSFSGTKFYAVCSQDNSTVTLNGGTYTKAITGAAGNMFYVTSGSVMNIVGGTYTKGSLKKFINGINPVITGGTFDFDPTNNGVADGYEAVNNGNGTWTVGKVVTGELTPKAGTTPTETAATYSVEATVQDAAGKTLEEKSTQTVTVSIVTEADNKKVASDAKISKLDMQKVVAKAIAEAADDAQNINVSIAVVSETPAKVEKTYTYEVYPEATVTVNNETSSTVKLANSDLADGASFTFTLNVSGKFDDGASIQVVHTSADFEPETFTTSVVDGKVTISEIKHFSSFKLSEVIPASISEVGFATFSSTKAVDFTDIDAIHAYTATVNGSRMEFTRIYKVPANTGLLLRNPSGAKAVTVGVPVIEDFELEDLVNALVAVTKEDIAQLPETSKDGNYKNYILNKVNGEVGFYRSGNKSVAKGRAYLQVPTSSNVQSFTNLFDGETTAIDSITTADEQTQDNVFYDLSGRRVNNPQRGLYIVNGKKVLVK